MNRCDSGTDSKVWMEEGDADFMICRIMDELLAPDITGAFLLYIAKAGYIPNCGFVLWADEMPQESLFQGHAFIRIPKFTTQA